MNPQDFLETLISLPVLDSPKISRDGKWAAWTWYRAGPAADVYAVATDGSAPPIRLTETRDNTVIVSWAPDCRSVIVAQDHDGDERDQLFRVWLQEPGVMVPLTEPSPQFFLRGGQLHPDGRWLIYGANWDEEVGREIEPTWLYRHDLQTGERLPLTRPQRACYYHPTLNEQGTHILYLRADRSPAGRQVWMVDINGAEDREIISAGVDKKASAEWFPDGQRLLVLSDADTYQRVGVWEMADGSLRWLLDDPGRNIEAVHAPHGSDRAVLVESRDARTRASLIDPTSGEELFLPSVPGNLIPLAPVGEAEWIGLYYSSQQPEDLVRFSVERVSPKAFTSLTRVWERTPLEPADLAPAENVHWQAPDGLEIQGWLYRARATPRGTLVYVHGGPTWHSTDSINAQIQFFVSQGFNVLDPNYRGSTGFGRPFREAIKAEGWGAAEQEDIRAGIEALFAAGIARPGKVGITGTSYGGYSAWHAITHFPKDIVAAAAPICGMTDLVVDYETTRPDLRPFSEEMLGGSPDQVPDRYRQRSPLHYVDNIKGKLLIVQGLQDPNVTPENVRVVRAALDQAGVEYELLVFEDEGHGIARPKNHRVLYPRLAEFFGTAFASD
jgi:dipeptidyl aminopeptidase/acylaminoacyl peptidase